MKLNRGKKKLLDHEDVNQQIHSKIYANVRKIRILDKGENAHKTMIEKKCKKKYFII